MATLQASRVTVADLLPRGTSGLDSLTTDLQARMRRAVMDCNRYLDESQRLYRREVRFRGEGQSFAREMAAELFTQRVTARLKNVQSSAVYRALAPLERAALTAAYQLAIKAAGRLLDSSPMVARSDNLVMRLKTTGADRVSPQIRALDRMADGPVTWREARPRFIPRFVCSKCCESRPCDEARYALHIAITVAPSVTTVHGHVRETRPYADLRDETYEQARSLAGLDSKPPRYKLRAVDLPRYAHGQEPVRMRVAAVLLCRACYAHDGWIADWSRAGIDGMRQTAARYRDASDRYQLAADTARARAVAAYDAGNLDGAAELVRRSTDYGARAALYRAASGEVDRDADELARPICQRHRGAIGMDARASVQPNNAVRRARAITTQRDVWDVYRAGKARWTAQHDDRAIMAKWERMTVIC